ncbi:heparanase isoform X2 [Chiloscyllium plagiosum]|uniref:heparanase isoform X2 n=1 Tax=Chiloscyllium plagiosum TaxID=36176 RepID=UPI001CB88917|nr:heparanase isoform X2 [Chiloscyllium plagiosum]
MPFLELLTACLLGWAAASPRSVRVQPKFTRSLRTVSPRFLSVALDASLLRTDSLDLLRSQKLITLAKGLSPGYLRFGGTGADFVLFEPSDQLSLPQEHGWESSRIEGTCLNTIPDDVEKYLTHLLALQAPVILKEQFQQDFKNITISEPNSFRKKAHIKIHGSQLGQDFEHLYNLLHTFKSFNHSGLYGPDIGQPGRQAIVTLLKGFLKTGGNVLSAITWHHYYLNGRTASLKDFLNPQVLDSLILKINQIFEIASKIAPEKKVWLGETSSAFGGGAPDLSDTYVAGFMWLDKLGLSAKLGIDVVIRQALFGAGFYQLVDRTLDPLPDYWLSLIYKRLVGTRVLNVSAVHKDTADNGTLRVYMHCTNPNSYIYRKGSVTMFALNLSDQDKHILLCCSLFNKTIQYLLQPGDSRKGLYSQSVQLNGKLLKMVDRKTLPIITGKVLQPGKPIVLPALSYAFYVVQDAKAPACQ